jgi:hypothetical protein
MQLNLTNRIIKEKKYGTGTISKTASSPQKNQLDRRDFLAGGFGHRDHRCRAAV